MKVSLSYTQFVLGMIIHCLTHFNGLILGSTMRTDFKGAGVGVRKLAGYWSNSDRKWFWTRMVAAKMVRSDGILGIVRKQNSQNFMDVSKKRKKRHGYQNERKVSHYF